MLARLCQRYCRKGESALACPCRSAPSMQLFSIDKQCQRRQENPSAAGIESIIFLGLVAARTMERRFVCGTSTAKHKEYTLLRSTYARRRHDETCNGIPSYVPDMLQIPNTLWMLMIPPPAAMHKTERAFISIFDACAIIPFSLLTQRWLPAYSVGVFQTSAGGFEQGSFAATEHEAASAALRL